MLGISHWTRRHLTNQAHQTRDHKRALQFRAFAVNALPEVCTRGGAKSGYPTATRIEEACCQGTLRSSEHTHQGRQFPQDGLCEQGKYYEAGVHQGGHCHSIPILFGGHGSLDRGTKFGQLRSPRRTPIGRTALRLGLYALSDPPARARARARACVRDSVFTRACVVCRSECYWYFRYDNFWNNIRNVFGRPQTCKKWSVQLQRDLSGTRPPGGVG